MPPSDGSRRYTDDEARAIFERALTAQADARVGHEELVAAAGEVGLSRESVERAIAEIQVLEAEREATRAILRRRRRRLVNHLVPFLFVNLFLLVVNWLTTPGAWWCLFPLVTWGLVLFFHAWFALSSRVSPAALRRELARSERQQRRSLREILREEQRDSRRQRHERLQERAKLLGEAVEDGVAVLLGRLAHQLGEGKRPPTGVRVEPSRPPKAVPEESEPPAQAADPKHSRS